MPLSILGILRRMEASDWTAGGMEASDWTAGVFLSLDFTITLVVYHRRFRSLIFKL